MYQNKFTKIFESNFQRFQGGGILAGDIVKFIDNVTSDEWFTKQNDAVRDKVQSMIDGDLNLRIGSVSAKRPAAQGAVQQDQQVDDFYCDVVKELAPGLFTDVTTVPIHLVQKIDTDNNLAPVPDSVRYDDKSHVKPEEVAIQAGDDESNAVFGTKTHEGDKKLHGKDVPGINPNSIDNFTTAAYLK